MGGIDGGHGHRVWPETIQVDKESGLEVRSQLEAKGIPPIGGIPVFHRCWPSLHVIASGAKQSQFYVKRLPRRPSPTGRTPRNDISVVWWVPFHFLHPAMSGIESEAAENRKILRRNC
jgi:hypothetical protein